MKPFNHKGVVKGNYEKIKMFFNNFLRTKSQEDKLKFNKQRNFCKKRLMTTKKLYCSNVGFKKVVDNSF